MTKSEKETRHHLYVFIKKKMRGSSAKCALTVHADDGCTVHFHRHDMSIVLLNCLITNMMHTLSYQCSNWAGDNQLHLKILL